MKSLKTLHFNVHSPVCDLLPISHCAMRIIQTAHVKIVNEQQL